MYYEIYMFLCFSCTVLVCFSCHDCFGYATSMCSFLNNIDYSESLFSLILLWTPVNKFINVLLKIFRGTGRHSIYKIMSNKIMLHFTTIGSRNTRVREPQKLVNILSRKSNWYCKYSDIWKVLKKSGRCSTRSTVVIAISESQLPSIRQIRLAFLNHVAQLY